MTEITKETIRQMRVKYNFDTKYADKGGWAKLVEMVGDRKTQREIADYFGLRPSRIERIYRDVTSQPWPFGPGVRKEAD